VSGEQLRKRMADGGWQEFVSGELEDGEQSTKRLRMGKKVGSEP
jgi:hypothetical protein